MAIETECQTPGAIFSTKITDKAIFLKIALPFALPLNEKSADLLEKQLHNAAELVLSPYFIKKPHFKTSVPDEKSPNSE